MSNKHLERALFLMEKRPDKAAEELRLALAEDPENGHLHGLLAACHLDCGKTDAAYEEARMAIGADPTAPLGFSMLAHCHFRQGKLLEAEVAIEEAMKLDPWETAYHALLANIEIQNGNLERALEATEHGLEIAPNDVQCHNLRALILSKMGKSAQAQESMDTAMAEDPEDAVTHAYRGWTLIEQNNYEESRAHFREALRLDPTSEWARRGLIKSLQMRNWAYTWHRKLKSRWTFVAALGWAALNIQLIGITNNAVSTAHMALVAVSFLSWSLLLGLAFFVFLPYTFVAEPILRLLLQFDPDGKFVLTPDEQRFNKHATVFICCGLLSVVVGIVTNFWWLLGGLFVLYVATLPIGYPEEYRRKWTVWAGHVGGAVVVGVLVVLAGTGQGSAAQGILAARFLLIPSMIKAGAGVSLVKIFASGPVLKGLGLLGMGGALQAWKEKEKQKVRKKMLSDANTPPKKK